MYMYIYIYVLKNCQNVFPFTLLPFHSCIFPQLCRNIYIYTYKYTNKCRHVGIDLYNFQYIYTYKYISKIEYLHSYTKK